MDTRIKAPGLKIRRRANGVAYYWIARADAVKSGYPSGTINLSHLDNGTPEGSALIVSQCEKQEAAMLYWLAGNRRERGRYDGSLRSVFDVYETHPDSPFHGLKRSTREVYGVYLKLLKKHVGARARQGHRSRRAGLAPGLDCARPAGRRAEDRGRRHGPEGAQVRDHLRHRLRGRRL
jgi:hypothetical protein